MKPSPMCMRSQFFALDGLPIKGPGSLPKTRLELVRPYDQRILSPQRLPVSPLGLGSAGSGQGVGVFAKSRLRKTLRNEKVDYRLRLCNLLVLLSPAGKWLGWCDGRE